MQWENNGGGQGPWGSNTPKGGGGNKGSSTPPPDMDEIFRKGKEQFDSFFNRNGDGGWPSIIIVAVVLLFIWLGSGFYTIAEEQQGVVLRFGAFHRQTDPGLHFHAPYPIESVIKVPVQRVNKVEVGVRSSVRGRDRGKGVKVLEESLMLTGDENIVDIDFEVQWKIADAEKFLFNVRDPDTTVKSVAESAMREVIARTELDSALTEGRLGIEQDVQDIIQSVLQEYDTGVNVLRVLLRETQPPAAVIDAFRDVQTAKADQERLKNEGETYFNDVVPRAQGRAQQIINEAEGYRQEVIARSKGEADRFIKVYNEYKNAKDVTRKRIYLETMEAIMADMDKIVVDDRIGGGGVVPYLPLKELKK